MRTPQPPKKALSAMGALLFSSLLLMPAPSQAQPTQQQGNSAPSRPSASAPSRSAGPSASSSRSS